MTTPAGGAGEAARARAGPPRRAPRQQAGPWPAVPPARGPGEVVRARQPSFSDDGM